jgi:serine/threonine protein kinase
LPGFNAFSCGMQHCDVKPANLLLVGDRLKVADFGLAAATTARKKRDLGCRGSLPYAPPELFRGQPSPTSDQYALAVTWCEVCAGPGTLTPAARIETSPGILPADLTQLPDEERVVVKRALDPDPGRRWPDCRTFLAELRAVQGALV